MSEWIELPTMQDVAKAQADGWEIECRFYGAGPWSVAPLTVWTSDHEYRGRPRQPKTKEVVLRVPVFKRGDIWIACPSTENFRFLRDFIGYLDELPHRWENGKLIVEVPE